jgi:hypothetical protein
MSEKQKLSDMTPIDIALKYKDYKLAKKLYRETLQIETKTARVLKDIPYPDTIAYFTSCGLYPVERAYENLPIVALNKPAPKANEIVEYVELPEFYQYTIKDYVVLYTYGKV